MSDSLLTEEEVKSYLELAPPEIEKLVRRGKLTAYRLGGAFVRFRKDEVIALKAGRKFRMPDQLERPWFDKVKDFFNFYGLYLLLSVLILAFVVYFVQG